MNKQTKSQIWNLGKLIVYVKEDLIIFVVKIKKIRLLQPANYYCVINLFKHQKV